MDEMMIRTALPEGSSGSLQLLERVRSGDSVALGRLISRVETGLPEVYLALAEIYKQAGRAHIVGITGVPGGGKSTLVGELAREIRNGGRKVAIVAIDPSSPFSGGAILGDRIRMDDLTMDRGVFIRSMASRGATGGLARAALSVVDVLDVAGFEIIIVETVGVGQDEVEIARASHTTVVVSPPGLGDDVQAIKAGILEIADIHVVSKADRPEATRAVSELQSMLGLAGHLGQSPRKVSVVACSAHTKQGVAELLVEIDSHGAIQKASEAGVVRARRIAEYRALKAAEDLLRRRFSPASSPRLEALVAKIVARETDPYSAAQVLFADANIERQACVPGNQTATSSEQGKIHADTTDS